MNKNSPVVHVSDQQKMYVLTTEGGVSTLGFSVCTQQSALLAGFLLGLDSRIKLPRPEIEGTVAHYRRYEKLQNLAFEYCRERGRICPVLLEPQLRGLEGKKVEVCDCFGNIRSFVVGRSCGWMPVHIELQDAEASGGHAVTGAPFEKVRVLSGYTGRYMRGRSKACLGL